MHAPFFDANTALLTEHKADGRTQVTAGHVLKEAALFLYVRLS
jgi:hypothetical protein